MDLTENIVFYAKRLEANAQMIWRGNEFVVLKNSHIRTDTTDSCPASVKKKQEELASNIQNGVLMIDVPFKSASAAAGFALGMSANGNIEWKDKDGNPLDMYRRKKQEQTGVVFYAQGTDADAQMLWRGDEDEFIVLKNSRIRTDVTSTCPASAKNKQQELASKIKDGILRTDVVFPSPSAAACFALGRIANGNTEWVDSDGNTLEMYRRMEQELTGKLFIAKGQDADARMLWRDDEFIVLKNSLIRTDTTDSCPPAAKQKQEELASKIKDGILKVDVSFSSPSAAACFALGRSANGLTEWKDELGKTLKSYKDKE